MTFTFLGHSMTSQVLAILRLLNFFFIASSHLDQLSHAFAFSTVDGSRPLASAISASIVYMTSSSPRAVWLFRAASSVVAALVVPSIKSWPSCKWCCQSDLKHWCMDQQSGSVYWGCSNLTSRWSAWGESLGSVEWLMICKSSDHIYSRSFSPQLVCLPLSEAGQEPHAAQSWHCTQCQSSLSLRNRCSGHLCSLSWSLLKIHPLHVHLASSQRCHASLYGSLKVAALTGKVVCHTAFWRGSSASSYMWMTSFSPIQHA